MAVLPTLSTMCIVISASLVGYGWYLIKQGKKEKHAKTMKLASLFALGFFVLYLSRTILVGSSLFGGPDELKKYYHGFLLFHILFATISAFIGIVTIRFALKRKLANHKKWGPWTAGFWIFSSCTGVMVYLFLYVLYPSTETTSLLRVILGW